MKSKFLFLFLFVFVVPYVSSASEITNERKELLPKDTSSENRKYVVKQDLFVSTYDNLDWLSVGDDANDLILKDIGLAEYKIWLYIKANAKGDKNEILEFWNTNERSSIKSYMTDEAIETNSKIFSGIKKIKFIKTLYYGDYRIVYVMQDNVAFNLKSLKTYVLRNFGGDFYMSNMLSNDLFVQYFTKQMDINYKDDF